MLCQPTFGTGPFATLRTGPRFNFYWLRDAGLRWLAQVVHRRDPRAAERPSRVWRSSVREVPVDPLGQALLRSALPPWFHQSPGL